MFPVSPRGHISLSPCRRFPCIQEYISPVGFDSHNPFPALHKRSVYQFHHGEILLLPKESGSDRTRTCTQQQRLGHPCSKPVELQNHCFSGFPGPTRTTLPVLYSKVKSKPACHILKMFSGGIPTHTRDDLTNTGHSRLVHYLLRHG